MILRAAILLLLAATPAVADEAACLAAPTRACLFDLARTRIDATEDPQDAQFGLLYLAAWQEKLGLDGWEETTARMLEIWRASEPVPEVRVHELKNLAYFNLVGGVPGVSEAIAEAVAAEEVHYPYTNGAVTYREPRWSKEVGVALLSRNPERIQQALSLVEPSDLREPAEAAAKALLRERDIGGAVALAGSLPVDGLVEDVREMVFESVLGGGRFELALAMAEAREGEGAVASGLVDVATALARDGRVEDAVALMQRPEVLAAIGLDKDIATDAALVHAYAGDTERVELLLSVNRASLSERRGSFDPLSLNELDELRPLLVAAMVNADEDRAVALMARIEGKLFGFAVQGEAIHAFLDAHPDGVPLLLSHVPADRLADVLSLVAGHRAVRGDLDGAMDAFAMLRTIDGAPDSARVPARILAPSLARAGRAQEAVVMAELTQDVTMLLQVAVLIEDPEFPRADFPVMNILLEMFSYQ